MRLGIFGGTFDPIHYGHLLLAECCRDQLALDEVWFLPASTPPHKQDRELAPGDARAEMLELAVAGHAPFRVCRHELQRGGVSYTVDTLRHFHQEHPAAELFFLMGGDSLRDLPTWREPTEICRLAVPVIVDRATGEPRAPLDLTGLEGIVAPQRLEAIRAHRVQMPRIDLSSSEIRRLVAGGHSIRFRTPRAVEKYIETHGLYRASSAAQRPASRPSGN